MDAFEFLTSTGERLSLFGESLSYNDEIGTGTVERQILHRNGAVFQLSGTPPRRFVFQCCMHGPDVQSRYRRLDAVVRADPTGQLVHPRLGPVPAVCEGVSGGEITGDARDTINYTIKFAEDGLHDAPKPSPVAAASAASAEAASLSLGAANYPSPVVQATQAVQSACSAFLSRIGDVQAGLSSVLTLDSALSAVLLATDQLVKNPQLPGSLSASAALVYSRALESYNRVLAGRPPIVTYTVRSSMSLQRLMAQLYGAAARDMNAQVSQLNRLPRPYALPVGLTLQIPSPDAVRSAARF